MLHPDSPTYCRSGFVRGNEEIEHLATDSVTGWAMKESSRSALFAKWAWHLRYLVPVLVVLLGVPSTASAHAILVSSNPNNGAVIAGPNLAVLLSFNSRIDRSRSRLTIDGPERQGAVVSIEGTDQRPAVLSAKLSGLKAGSYTLHWQVLAADGHITRGIISFRIK